MSPCMRVVGYYWISFAAWAAVCWGYRLPSSMARAGGRLQAQVNDNIPLTTNPPYKVLLLVEPTPFNYISGYANRFKEMLFWLKAAGDSVSRERFRHRSNHHFQTAHTPSLLKTTFKICYFVGCSFCASRLTLSFVNFALNTSLFHYPPTRSTY
jgi:hypothetical protein